MDLTVFSDDSGSWGRGVVLGLQWLPTRVASYSMSAIHCCEGMIPMVLAAASFGRAWSGKHIQFVVDIKVVVSVLSSTTLI